MHETIAGDTWECLTTIPQDTRRVWCDIGASAETSELPLLIPARILSTRLHSPVLNILSETHQVVCLAAHHSSYRRVYEPQEQRHRIICKRGLRGQQRVISESSLKPGDGDAECAGPGWLMIRGSNTEKDITDLRNESDRSVSAKLGQRC